MPCGSTRVQGKWMVAMTCAVRLNPGAVCAASYEEKAAAAKSGAKQQGDVIEVEPEVDPEVDRWEGMKWMERVGPCGRDLWERRTLTLFGGGAA